MKKLFIILLLLCSCGGREFDGVLDANEAKMMKISIDECIELGYKYKIMNTLNGWRVFCVTDFHKEVYTK